jgi:hypothetical protein
MFRLTIETVILRVPIVRAFSRAKISYQELHIPVSNQHPGSRIQPGDRIVAQK